MGKLLEFRPKDGRGPKDDDNLLDGLTGLAVVIEDLDTVSVETGLNRTMLQALAERLLIEAQIPVVPLAAIGVDPQSAVLYIQLGAERSASGEIAWLMSLQVCENAVLVRDSDRRGGVATWTTNGVFSSSRTDFLRDVVEAVDEGIERLRASFRVAEHA